MERLHSLDGVRGILAVYVMISHMVPFMPAPPWLAHMLSHGGAAVDIFFILSGLVISQSLRRYDNRAVPFLMARAGRTLPAYMVVLALAVIVQPWPTGLANMPWVEIDNPGRAMWSQGWPDTWAVEILAHVFMVHGVFPNGVLPHVWISFLGAAWSLSAEWQFYLVALGLGRLGFGHRSLAVALLCLAAGGALWDALSPEAWQFSRAFLPNKAHYFALGVASWGVVRNRGRQRWFFGTVLSFTLVLTLPTGSLAKLLPPLAWTLCLMVELLPHMAIVLPVGRILRSAACQWLGRISYSIYLINEPVQKMLGSALATLVDGDVRLFTGMWLPLALLLPLIAAMALHRWVEEPARRWTQARVMGLHQRGLPLRAGLGYTGL